MMSRTAEALRLGADDAGHDLKVIDDYSGRGMRGKITVAVSVHNITELISIVAHAVVIETTTGDQEYLQEFLDDLRHLSTDSFGLGIVVY